MFILDIFDIDGGDENVHTQNSRWHWHVYYIDMYLKSSKQWIFGNALVVTSELTHFLKRPTVDFFMGGGE